VIVQSSVETERAILLLFQVSELSQFI